MNDEQWSWVTRVIGVHRDKPGGDKAGRPDAGADEPVAEPLVMDMEAMFVTNDAPINTVAFRPQATTPPASGGAPPTGSGPGATSAAPASAPPANDPDRKAVNDAMNDVSRRYKALTTLGKTYEMVAAQAAFFAVYTPWRKLFDAGDFAGAKALTAGVEPKLKALEDLSAALPGKTLAATEAAGKVNTMKAGDLAKLPVAEKAKLVQTMLAAGMPTGDTRKAQIKVYKAMSLDKTFMKADETRGKAIAKELKGDKELKAARKGWKTASEDDKIKALKKVVTAQCKQFGIPVPEIVVEHQPPANGMVTNGYFAPSDGKLHINMDPNSSVQNFQRAVDLAIHENAHNWQATLVAQLKAGTIAPGDPNYTQALMFAVNELHPGGYVKGEEDYDAYKKQPLEDHAWTTGPSTAKKIMKGL